MLTAIWENHKSPYTTVTVPLPFLPTPPCTNIINRKYQWAYVVVKYAYLIQQLWCLMQHFFHMLKCEQTCCYKRGSIRTNVLTCRRQSNQLISSHFKAVCSPASDFEDGQSLRKLRWMSLLQLQIHMLQIKHSLNNNSGVTQMNTWTARLHLKKRRKKRWHVAIEM